MQHDIHEQLSAPFEDSDIEWRLQWTDDEKGSGLAVPYVTNRAIQNRLDKVAGADGWKNEYIPWHSDGKKSSQLCGISIYFESRGEWVTKYDGADDSDIEPIKGGLSDSMKRAAVQWGIGRYLYTMDTVFVDTEKRGKTTVIKKGAQPKLDEAHRKAVAAIFGAGQPAPQPQNAAQPNSPASQQQAQRQAKTNTPQPQQPTQAPAPQPTKTVSAQQAQSSASSSAPQPASSSPPSASSASTATPQPAPKTQKPVLPLPTPISSAASSATPRDSYCVANVAVKTSAKGQYTTLQLKGARGDSFMALMNGGDPTITSGAWLDNAVISTKTSEGVIFYTLESYNLRAGKAA